MPTAFQIEKTKAILLLHRIRVTKYMSRFIESLVLRLATHDDSKMQEEEFGVYCEVIDEFEGLKFGSPGYDEIVKKLSPAKEHHFFHNRHHPEHFETGINEMNLADLIEMLCDWKSATLNKGGSGDLDMSIRILSEKYDISPQLKQILINTAKDFGLYD